MTTCSIEERRDNVEATLGSRIRVGVLWNLIAMTTNQGSTLVANVFVARILGRETFGAYSIIQSTLISFTVLANLCLGYTATKYVAEFRSVDKARTGRIMALCFLVTIILAFVGTAVLLIAAPSLAAHMLKAREVAIPLSIGAGYLFFSAINYYQTGALSGLEAYRGLAVAGIFSGCVAIGGIVLGAWRWGLNGAAAALSITALFRCFFHRVCLRWEMRAQEIVPSYNGALQEKGIVFGFAIPSILSGYVFFPISWLATALLVRQQDGFAQLAIYSACSTLRMLVLFIPGVINTVGLSVLNHLKGQGDASRYRKLAAANTWWMVAVSGAAAIFVSIFGDTVLSIYGREFVGGHQVLMLLLLATIPESVYAGLYQHIQVSGRMWLSLFGIIFPWQLSFGLLAFVLVPRQKALGLAMAYLLASLVQIALAAFHSRRVRHGSDDSASRNAVDSVLAEEVQVSPPPT